MNFIRHIVALLFAVAFFTFGRGDVLMWEISPTSRVVGARDVNSAYVLAVGDGFNNVEGEPLVVPAEESLPELLEGVVPEPSTGLLVAAGIGVVMLRRRRSE